MLAVFRMNPPLLVWCDPIGCSKIIEVLADDGSTGARRIDVLFAASGLLSSVLAHAHGLKSSILGQQKNAGVGVVRAEHPRAPTSIAITEHRDHRNFHLSICINLLNKNL
ncbi:hypothetical protein GXY_03063 [Novacetimonas hansenii ATCC 23769]|uniref:Uncharacterized protein n=1 Tax=Novacetimonas hansenii ATCC 23769 TaxID=714995 RepID=D5QBW6_NOVHA|nr:hypothetical protein GXY_03063 [Novacetimonas hansenii ATCC 23769]